MEGKRVGERSFLENGFTLPSDSRRVELDIEKEFDEGMRMKFAVLASRSCNTFVVISLESNS